MSNWTTLLLAGSIALALTSCGGYVGSHPTGTGPFDSRGNYVEAWADSPSKWNGSSVPKPADQPKTQPTTQPQPEPPVVAQVTPTTPTAPTPPRPAVTPKPKPKPKPTPKYNYHTVSRGDTLYGLAKRYGTTVGKIQSANGIKGTVIRPGQRLKISR